MDGQMSEDIRVGIMVGVRIRHLMREAEERAIAADPGQFHVAEWKKKGSSEPGTNFSSYVLEAAGGIDRLFAEWELRVVPVGKRG